MCSIISLLELSDFKCLLLRPPQMHFYFLVHKHYSFDSQHQSLVPQQGIGELDRSS